jgi:segregation and condensation protein A
MAPRTDAAILTRKPGKRHEKISPLGVVAPPPIQVESPHFTGSLAMLFTCVHERKVDLLQVPLFPICEAYFLYMVDMSQDNLDEAAAALIALAYLLERKAWMLLPSPEPEPESDEAMELLPPSVHEYAFAIDVLKIWQEERERFFFRSSDASPEPYEVPYTLGNVSPADLARALERVMKKATPEPIAPLSRPRRSLSDQMKLVMKTLQSDYKPLDELIATPFTREDVVYWFLALLELIRLGQATVRLRAREVEFARR